MTGRDEKLRDFVRWCALDTLPLWRPPAFVRHYLRRADGPERAWVKLLADAYVSTGGIHCAAAQVAQVATRTDLPADAAVQLAMAFAISAWADDPVLGPMAPGCLDKRKKERVRFEGQLAKMLRAVGTEGRSKP